MQAMEKTRAAIPATSVARIPSDSSTAAATAEAHPRLYTQRCRKRRTSEGIEKLAITPARLIEK